MLPVFGLGIVLGQQLRDIVRDGAVDDGRRIGELVTRLGLQPHLEPADFARGLDPGRYARLDRSVRDSGFLGGEVARVKVWNADGVVVYSDDPALVGRRFDRSPGLARALAGHTHSELLSRLEEAEQASERDYGAVVEVYVPVRFAGDAAPRGAFELYLPYAPIERKVNAEVRRLYVFLAGGLILLAGLLAGVAVMTERLRRQAAANRHLALHDALTGLPNRTMLYDRLDQALLAGNRSGAPVALIAVDLDGFKEVNDTLGHQAGDRVLMELADRLRGQARAADTVARLGGDEFAVLLPASDIAGAREVAERMQRRLTEPLLVAGERVRLRASMGIAVHPLHATQPDSLLGRADLAMYAAKYAALGVVVWHHDIDQMTGDAA
ncbi:GGDEF domain-containing protein [Micromonospora pattaloongensis]|uniref:GGDEF domain-containing protein n=1 Tax=Micromonospora pattaloongensis TaxID=405436 RepID=UPI0015879E59|nr:GGDEF domain-containing protein [Micromonospora pattaloongensis]